MLAHSTDDSAFNLTAEGLINAFTVDVEDYFQVSAFERDINRDIWDTFEHRVVSNTSRMLDLLAKHRVTATFFVLGWTARRFPELVRKIDAAGHEIASHGFWHHLVYEQTSEEFRQDICESRDLLADLIDKPVTIYRAPSFSITDHSAWALEILAEEGFTTDCSVFPIHHDRYGMPDAEPIVHQRWTPSGNLVEFPPAVLRCKRVNLPVGGGGYFRLLPLHCVTACLRHILRAAKMPFMFYVHPWEIDPAQPKVSAGNCLSRFRHRVNLSRTYAKLEHLLTQFRFGTVTDSVKSVGDLLDRGVPSANCGRKS
ncbi:MAG: DUF3473 domain-containing protein [Pirellulales bacterium]|nr:DUF3473 domain-containing protein [Pirellulales bacterium]